MKYTIIVEWFDTDREVGEMYSKEVGGSLAQATEATQHIIATFQGMPMRVVDAARIERNSDEEIVWTWERTE